MQEMGLRVLDNWLDLEFCDHLAYDILYNMKHTYGHTSDNSKETPRFYRADFVGNNFHIKYMCRKLSREVIQSECQFSIPYANIQFKGMDGAFHRDDGDFTVIYMVTPTLEGSGHFEYEDGNAVKQVDFVQNRLIVFEGSTTLHRGLSPDSDLPRVTIAFKVTKSPSQSTQSV